MLKRRICSLALAISFLFVIQGNGFAQGMPAGGTQQTVTQTVTAPAYSRALKRGCRGADVKALQQKLAELKFFSGTADGVFGTATMNAVKTFQSAHSLKADGIVGKTTYTAIYGTPTSSTGTTGGTTTGGDIDGYTLGKLNNEVTLRKGSTGSNVKDMQAVLKIKGFYSGPISGSFLAATKNAVMSFQHSLQLKTDGVAGNYTLSPLYSMLNPPDLSSITTWPQGAHAYAGMAVEKLQWSVAANVFKRTMTAVVVDVRSGYVFNIKRTGGTNHADVETLTPADTATFFKCDGKFSWDRRPIWVIVNGRRLAASMNCMPHGYDTISGNDMKGQFCIHFVNSRTHDTNRIDPLHQACIVEAYNAGLADTAAAASPSPTTSSPTVSTSPTDTPDASTTPTASAATMPPATQAPGPTPAPGGDDGTQMTPP